MTTKAERARVYYLANRERLLAKDAAYRAAHRDEKAEYKRQWYEANRTRILEVSRAYYERTKESSRPRRVAYSRRYNAENRDEVNRKARVNSRAHADACRASRRRHPDRVNARTAVNRAVRAGRLLREPCRRCGASAAQAHHHNGYGVEHRLDVTWLCRTHHGEAHRVVLDAPV